MSKSTLQQTRQQLSIHSGPLPSPEQLLRYNDAVPDAADRIIRMAETQLEHRIQNEKLAIRTQARNSTLGIISAFLIGMTIVFCATFLVWSGHSITGFSTLVVGIGSLVGVFIYKKEPEKKST